MHATMKFCEFLLCLILIRQTYSSICPGGSYLSSHEKKCHTYPAGSSCAGDNYRKVQCMPGYYAETPGSTSCKICPTGHSCYSVNQSPVKCSKGQYQNQTGQRSCKRCKDGEYNIQIGRSTKCDICPLGHRCDDVTKAPVKCQKGQYQDQIGQRSCKRCKDGEYNIQTGRSTKCDICPVGHHCDDVTKAPIKCQKGQYQDQIGQRSCKQCKDGEYSLKAGRSTKCDICPVGHHCDDVTKAPIKCQKGQYQDQTGQKYCKRCKDGEYNIQTGRSTKCDICPFGHHCDDVNKAPVKCQKGQYQDQTGQRSCKRCKDGEYNIQTGRSTKCNICPVGHYCYDVTKAPVKCQKGQYQDQTGQRSCKQCKGGQYTLQTGSTKCKSCPAGSKCP